MTRKELIGEIVLQLEKLNDESLEYLSHWSMPWGVLPLLHDFEDGKLMRDVDCEMHVALECQERDELLKELYDLAAMNEFDVGEEFRFHEILMEMGIEV